VTAVPVCGTLFIIVDGKKGFVVNARTHVSGEESVSANRLACFVVRLVNVEHKETELRKM